MTTWFMDDPFDDATMALSKFSTVVWNHKEISMSGTFHFQTVVVDSKIHPFLSKEDTEMWKYEIFSLRANTLSSVFCHNTL